MTKSPVHVPLPGVIVADIPVNCGEIAAGEIIRVTLAEMTDGFGVSIRTIVEVFLNKHRFPFDCEFFRLCAFR